MITIDPYSTHLSYLNNIFNICGKMNNAVEFGMGKFSTELLLKNTNKLISIEMQSDLWFNDMCENFKNYKNWEPHMKIGANEYNSVVLPNVINIAFVDGHGNSRPECIKLMMSMDCQIIVAHDTEESSYGWSRVINGDYKVLTFKKFNNWTTLWTKNDDLYNKMILFE